MNLSVMAKIGLILLISWISLALHELGHAIVYWIAGYPAWISFQRVHVDVKPTQSVEIVSLTAGPVFSLLIASIAMLWAQKRKTFILSTIAFANASLRIFPSAIAIFLATVGANKGFSDEGNIPLLLNGGTILRLSVPLGVFGVALFLSINAARTYHFQRHSIIKVVGVYLLSFSVGFLAFALDTFFGLAG